MKNKKGILGLNTATLVAIAFLAIAILAIMVIFILSIFQTGSVGDLIATTQQATEINETLAGMNNESGIQVVNVNLTDFRMVISPEPVCFNGTAGDLINGSNYTSFTNGSIVSVETNCSTGPAPYGYCSWDWLCTDTYTFSNRSTLDNLANPVRRGITEFFESSPTIFSILVVVIIILAISIIIFVIAKGMSDEKRGNL